MINSPQRIVNIVLGPPGTGKTTTLLRLLEQTLAGGVSPQQIGFFSFTRKAANEARDRAITQFGLREDQFPYFRTLHSMAFKHIGANPQELLRLKDYQELGFILGVRVTSFKQLDEGTMFGMEKGDRLFFMENLARIRLIPLKQLWEEQPNEDISWWELERIQKTLIEYKLDNQLIDYTDMIQRFIDSGKVPPLKVVFIDEAQDLSPMQWSMLWKICWGVERVYIAGDDDQAIFQWAGADIKEFINLKVDNQQVLNQSYRVPGTVHQVAKVIVDQIRNRRPKEWKPREFEGAVQYCGSLAEIDMSKGDWLLLARNSYLLQEFNEHCLQMGYSFDSQTGSPIRGEALEAIRLWEHLRKGGKISPQECLKIYNFMTMGKGWTYGSKSKIDLLENIPETVGIEALKNHYGLKTEAIWHEALDKIQVQEREYFLSALRTGEKLTGRPRIRINTIHRVKGGEAENVVILTDMASRTYEEMENNLDDELRVWYVAVTRAKSKLYIIRPRTNRSFEII